MGEIFLIKFISNFWYFGSLKGCCLSCRVFYGNHAMCFAFICQEFIFLMWQEHIITVNFSDLGRCSIKESFQYLLRNFGIESTRARFCGFCGFLGFATTNKVDKIKPFCGLMTKLHAKPIDLIPNKKLYRLPRNSAQNPKCS